MHGLERHAQAGVLAVDHVGRRFAHGQRVGQRCVARKHDGDLAAVVRLALAQHDCRDGAVVVLRKVERGAAAEVQAVGVGLVHDGGKVPLFRRDELADGVGGRRGGGALERVHAVGREVLEHVRRERFIPVGRGREQACGWSRDAAAAGAGVFELVQLGVERVEVALRDGAGRGAEEQGTEVQADVVQLRRAAGGDGGVELQDGAAHVAVAVRRAGGAARAREQARDVGDLLFQLAGAAGAVERGLGVHADGDLAAVGDLLAVVHGQGQKLLVRGDDLLLAHDDAAGLSALADGHEHRRGGGVRLLRRAKQVHAQIHEHGREEHEHGDVREGIRFLQIRPSFRRGAAGRSALQLERDRPRRRDCRDRVLVDHLLPAVGVDEHDEAVKAAHNTAQLEPVHEKQGHGDLFPPDVIEECILKVLCLLHGRRSFGRSGEYIDSS